jgi:hypothetical protein
MKECKHDVIRASHHRPQDEQDEVFIISETHTIGNPWTMMVHFQYTLSTDRAMVSTKGFRSFTLPANSLLAGNRKYIVKVVRRGRIVTNKVAGKHSAKVRSQKYSNNNIEDQDLMTKK